MTLPPLPIDAHMGDIVEVVQRRGCAVVTARPGAGKTTRLPPALLAAFGGTVICAQPRRLAARGAAAFVARERGEDVGASVGYQVRFESRVGPATRLIYMTEGLLRRRLSDAATLPGVSAVVLDEFHERHVETDLLLLLFARLRATERPDLKLVVMSATVDMGTVAAYLDDAPAIDVPGRNFPVTIAFADRHDDRPLPQRTAAAVRHAFDRADDAGDASASAAAGDVLVFLPGAGDIVRTAELLAPWAATRSVDVHRLHGRLTLDAQQRAIDPGPRRKVILATNVAETSLTIAGVTTVIDTGLKREAGFAPWSGLPTMRTVPISQAAAAQRAGRAGRVRAGTCIRLYTRHDHDTRPRFDAPEIVRAELSEVVLALRDAGVEPRRAPWLDAPPPAAIDHAERLLRDLGACDERGAITAAGHVMLALPTHPRLARLLLTAAAQGFADDGARLAALLGEADAQRVASLEQRRTAAVVSSDADALVALDGQRGSDLDRPARQLSQALGAATATAPAGPSRGADPRSAAHARDDALRLALLSAFSDRVAARRAPGSDEWLLCGGGSAVQDPASVVRHADLAVVVDAEQRRDGTRTRTVARSLCAVEPEWLLDLPGDRLRDDTVLTWDPQAERVWVTTRLRYEQLTLEERRRPPRDDESEAAAAALVAAATRAGLDRFIASERSDDLRARLALLDRGRAAPTSKGANVIDLDAVLARACRGLSSFRELAQADLWSLTWASLPETTRRDLERLTPREVALNAGRAVKVRYAADRDPWIETYLQDFFGMAAGPAIMDGALPLTLHLWAPNRRAVQITRDLASFWRDHYPSVRRELMRRYPRHHWPEDPTQPGPRLKPRRR